jgi:hypothetical protein
MSYLSDWNGNLELKGLTKPVAALNVTGLINGASVRPDVPGLVADRSAIYPLTTYLKLPRFAHD